MPGIIAESLSAVARKPTKNEQRRARQKQQKQEKQQNGTERKQDENEVSSRKRFLFVSLANIHSVLVPATANLHPSQTQKLQMR
jgi:hypothetical protein